MAHARRWQAMTWAALVAAVLTGVAYAAEPAATQKTVDVTLLGIHATNQAKPYVDAALKPIETELKRLKFNSFRLVANQTHSVAIGKEWELPMVEDYARRVQPNAVEGDKVKLTISWVRYVKDEKGKRKEEVRQRLVMQILKGKYVLSGGWKLKHGALLGAVAVK